MGAFAWFLICAGIGLSVYAALTTPTWFVLTMNRSALWRVRDEIFDHGRYGRLPLGVAGALVECSEALIVVLPDISVFQLWWLGRKVDLDEESEKLPWQQLVDPPAEVEKVVAFYMEQLGRIAVRHYLTGSWCGLLFVASRRIPVLRHVMRRPKHLGDAPSPVGSYEARTRSRVVNAVPFIRPGLVARNRSDPSTVAALV